MTAEALSLNRNGTLDGTHTLGRIAALKKRNTRAEVIDEIRSLYRGKPPPLSIHPTDWNFLDFGADSVAIRCATSSEPGRGQSVHVIRDQVLESLPEAIKQARKMQLSENEIASRLGDLAIPALYFIGSGLTTDYAIHRVKPRSLGENVGSKHFWHLVGYKAVVKDWRIITSKCREHFFQTGNLPDIVGFASKNRLNGLTVDNFPIKSKNLHVEMGSNRIKLIDCEMDPARHTINGTRLKYAIKTLLLLGGTYFTEKALEVVSTAQLLKESFFRIPKVAENSPIAEEFIDGFQQIVELLEGCGVEYRVFGGFAVSAHSGDFYTPFRENGTLRDVDVVLLTGDREKVSEIEKRIKKLRIGKKYFPEISLNPVLPINLYPKAPSGKFPRYQGIHVYDGQGKIFWKYGDLEIDVNNEITEGERVIYQGISFNSVSSGFLLFVALTRNGELSLRDQNYFERLNGKKPIEIPPRYCEFYRDIRVCHRDSIRNFCLRDFLDYWSGGLLVR